MHFLVRYQDYSLISEQSKIKVDKTDNVTMNADEEFLFHQCCKLCYDSIFL